MPTPQIFMSYTHADENFLGGQLTELRTELEKTLHFISGHHISIFQDIEGIHLGQNIQQRIAESLHETLVLIPIVTPSYIRSAWCRDEFTRFLERERILGRNDLIIPIYCQEVPEIERARQHGSADPIIQRIATHLGDDWRRLRGRSMNDDEVRSKLERIAWRIHDLIKEIENTTHVVGLYSHQPSQPAPVGACILDWIGYFAPSLPASVAWQTTLLPELVALRARLGQTHTRRRITLYGEMHPAVSMAFGYVFRESSGFQLVVEQQGQWWYTGRYDGPTQPLQEEQDELDAGGTDITVEISAVRGQDPSPAVTKWIHEMQPSLSKRVRLTLPGGTVTDAEHALAIAYQVRATLLRLRREQIPQTTHLFGVMPKGLAVLLGWHLNTCEPVQCYEYHRLTGTYFPACRLVP